MKGENESNTNDSLESTRSDLEEMLRDLLEHAAKQEEFNKFLLERLDKQDKFIKEILEKVNSNQGEDGERNGSK